MVDHIEYTVTGSEFESSLCLYQASLRAFGYRAKKRLRLRPPVFLRMSVDNPYPRVYVTAKISKTETKAVQQLAVRAFQAVDCAGLARVDFLMDPVTRKIYLNEINTMPGFTSISMYPKLWAASGLTYPELIDRLIQFGLERHAEKKQNQYSR